MCRQRKVIVQSGLGYQAKSPVRLDFSVTKARLVRYNIRLF